MKAICFVTNKNLLSVFAELLYVTIVLALIMCVFLKNGLFYAWAQNCILHAFVYM